MLQGGRGVTAPRVTLSNSAFLFDGDRARTIPDQAVIPRPAAIGRAGSRIHSLQEPAYRRAPVMPAASSASNCWQAVTPEPHMQMASLPAAPPVASRQRAASAAGGQEAAARVEIFEVRQVDRAGHVAGDRIERLDRTGEALGAAHVHEPLPARQRRGDAGGVDRAFRGAAARRIATAPARLSRSKPGGLPRPRRRIRRRARRPASWPT